MNESLIPLLKEVIKAKDRLIDSLISDIISLQN